MHLEKMAALHLHHSFGGFSLNRSRCACYGISQDFFSQALFSDTSHNNFHHLLCATECNKTNALRSQCGPCKLYNIHKCPLLKVKL